MRGSARGYALTAVGAVAGTAIGLGMGAWFAITGTERVDNAQGALAAFVSILFIPVLGGIGCVLACYVALRAAGEPAPFRTGLFTLALILVAGLVAGLIASLVPADSLVMMILLVAAAGVLGRRIALATVSDKALPPP